MPHLHLPDPSRFCPACERARCACPPSSWEDDQQADAYRRGHDEGARDGPENRPGLGWVTSPRNPARELFAESYLDGYDDGASGRPDAVLVALAARRGQSPARCDSDGSWLPF